VEALDRHFGNVCELDIVFHVDRVSPTVGQRQREAVPVVLCVWWLWQRILLDATPFPPPHNNNTSNQTTTAKTILSVPLSSTPRPFPTR